jgi:dTDP-4-dehydrorhamnose 3,5-epimerase
VATSRRAPVALLMKILSVDTLVIPDVKVIRFARFADSRGYFSEPFRRSDFDAHPELGFLCGIAFPQTNESWSRAGTVRGLHFQWNPFMGKLVRTIHGHMVDIFLDIRLGSPTFGKVAMHDMPATSEAAEGVWIWVPPGFAHGNYYPRESHIEYFCSGEYSPGCEAGLSPFAADFDWSLCDRMLKRQFDTMVATGPIVSDKDKQAPNLSQWQVDPRAQNFVYVRC